MLAFGRSRSFVLVLVAAVGAALLVALGVGSADDVGVAGAAGAVPAARSSHLGARLARLAHGRRLVAARSTRFSSTYRLADGSMVTRLSTNPLNFRDAGGRWRPIDDTLVARGGAFVNRADAHRVRLPRRLSSGVAVSAGRERLSMRLVGADGAAAVRGARASLSRCAARCQCDI